VRSALADPAVRRQFADQGQEIPAPEQQTPRSSRSTPTGRNQKVVANY
jgi:hypothetical protein